MIIPCEECDVYSNIMQYQTTMLLQWEHTLSEFCCFGACPLIWANSDKEPAHKVYSANGSILRILK